MIKYLVLLKTEDVFITKGPCGFFFVHLVVGFFNELDLHIKGRGGVAAALHLNAEQGKRESVADLGVGNA